ncbi:hypothetical protein L1987_67131 [Smallanthus sonchifolius]|uniref:Uncharacterized protein n=1 Tax=Smallanthus sonchifolius TaxID=185202 RepID=A0ACB9BZ84_9ASTR|nr:hypothetical protein L1987_67131 [Smallanthus sonchifolius]
MACALTSESRRLYSWWWDSHISPKNSKWLQEDLSDMDTKVKSMIKLIEEDADSFARRAEMYYKKRPELMKLVEEFYRAYRALAERYDYATGELRHAQKALQAAFPDQEPFTLPEDSSPPIDPDARKNVCFGLELFLEGKLQNTNEKDECEVERLKKAVADLIAEKNSLFVQHQFILDKVSNADGELNCAREKSRILEEKANEAEKEVHMLKETLGLLQAEKESGLTKQMEHLETISDLEEEINGAESDVQEMMNKLVGLESENDVDLLQYGICLERISVLKKKIVITEEEAKMFSEQAVKALMEVEKLKTALLDITEEKEALRVLYAECLEKSYKLELDLSSAQSDVQRLTTEILNSTKKLKHVEEICVCLETSNQSLKMEVGDLAKKIVLKDQELSDKHDELKSTEVEYVGLKEMKQRLEEEVALQLGQCTAMQKEIFNLKKEITKLNMSYNSLTSQLELTGLNPESFGSSVKYLQDENTRLKQICEENGDHEEKIKILTVKNTDLESSRELLHVEKSALVLEKTVLSSQLHIITGSMQKLIDQKSVVENSLSAANMELQNLREKSKGLEELCELLNNDKSNLLVERSMLASQLESVQKRLEGLENRFMQFEMEKETGNSRMLEFISCLTVEKQEQDSCMMMNDKRLDDLENHIQEFHKLKKEELQEELDKAVIAQFENFILHKFVKELEEENYSLSVENRKHIEASKLADKLISELETEILEQQVEEELLLVEVENLRLGLYQVFLSLETGSNPAKISTEEIICHVKDLKQSLSKEEDDKHRLLIENTIISTLLQESESHKEALMNKYETMKDDLFKVNKENLDLIKVNNNIGLQINMLDEEIEERENIQKNLTSELQERENELQLWDTEATKFIFDLQISNTREILFESKVHELAQAWESLEAETASKDREIEEMKQKESVMEREIEGLKAQLLAYTPVIGFLKASISSLEHNVGNLIVSNNRKLEDVEVKAHPHHNQSDPEVTQSVEPNGISDLIELQTRIAALEKVMVEDINTEGRRKSSAGMTIKPRLAKPETEESKYNKEEKLRGKRHLTLDNLNMIRKAKPELAEIRTGVPIRDIPLDQASDGSSSANSRSRSRRGYLRSDDMLMEQLQVAHKLPYEPQIEDLDVYLSNQESRKGKLILHDAHKLANLETTVKDLTQRLEAGGVDFKTVKQQLEKAEETISQLANMNMAAWVEQDDTWKRSERIKSVQLDVEKIQCVLLQVGDGSERKSSKGKGVILRELIHRNGRMRRRRLCGCFAPSPSPSPSPSIKY